MAFTGSDWGRRVKLTGLTPVATATGFVALITEDNVPTEAIDAGSNSALNGGGDLRFSTDDAGTNQLPLEVVKYVTSSTPSLQKAELWLRFTSYESAAREVWMFYKKAGETQPAVTDTYGRNSVWQDYYHVYHFSDNGTDSTGSGDDIDVTGATFVDADNGTRAININGTPYSVVSGTAQTTSEPLSYQARFRPSSLPSGVKTIFATSRNNANGQWVRVGLNNPANSNTIRGDVTSGGTQAAATISASVGTWNSVFFAVRSTTSRDVYGDGANKVSNTNTELLPTSATLIQVGARSNPSVDPFLGDIATAKILKTAPDDNFISLSDSNESSPSTFWTTGTPEDTGGGGGGAVIPVIMHSYRLRRG